jgi:hypothetical protein
MRDSSWHYMMLSGRALLSLACFLQLAQLAVIIAYSLLEDCMLEEFMRAVVPPLLYYHLSTLPL